MMKRKTRITNGEEWRVKNENDEKGNKEIERRMVKLNGTNQPFTSPSSSSSLQHAKDHCTEFLISNIFRKEN